MKGQLDSTEPIAWEPDDSLFPTGIPGYTFCDSPPFLQLRKIPVESVINSDLRIRVLVADAVGMSCQLLAEALVRSKRCDAVAATIPEKVFHELDRSQFDVVLISPSFAAEPLEGLRLVREVQSRHRGLGVVALLDTLEKNLVVEAFRAGARGVFCRSDSFQALCKCILCVHEGQVWAGSTELHYVLEALVDPIPIETGGLPSSRPLSKREEEIARMVAEGFSNRQISERLGLSEHTIKNYLFRVFEKLGVSTRVELTLFALKRGQISRTRSRAARPITLAEPKSLNNLNN